MYKYAYFEMNNT